MEKSQQITTKEKLLLERWKLSAEQDSKYFVFEKLSNNSQMMKHFMCALSTTSGPCCFQQSRRDKMNLHINNKRHVDDKSSSETSLESMMSSLTLGINFEINFDLIVEKQSKSKSKSKSKSTSIKEDKWETDSDISPDFSLTDDMIQNNFQHSSKYLQIDEFFHISKQLSLKVSINDQEYIPKYCPYSSLHNHLVCFH